MKNNEAKDKGREKRIHGHQEEERRLNQKMKSN